MSKKSKTTAIPKVKRGTAAQRYKTRAEREHEVNRVVLIASIAIAVVIIGIVATALINHAVIRPSVVVGSVAGQNITGRDLLKRSKFERWSLGNQLASIASQYGQSILTNSGFGLDTEYQSLQFPTILGQQVLSRMIDDAVIRKYAQDHGITVSPSEIDAEVYKFFSFQPTPGTATPTDTVTPTPLVANTATALPPTATPFPAGTPTPVPPTATPTPLPTGAPAPTLSLTEQFKAYRDSADRYYAATVKSASYNEADVREMLTTQALRKKVMQAVVGDPPKTQHQKRVRHILVKNLQDATDVMIALQKGESFAALAAAVSIDPGSKTQGGDLGWAGQDAGYVAEFEATIWGPDAKVGAILGPIDTSKYSTQDKQYGFHIIQITDEDQNRAISDSEGQTLQAQAFAKWLNEQRQSLNAVTYNPWSDFVATTPSLTDMGLPDSLSGTGGF